MQHHETEQNNNGAIEDNPDKDERRGRGKLAHLPKAIRDQVNTMIRDGVPYGDIRRRFLDSGHAEFEDISDKNISNWKIAGHQRWLREQEWRDDMQQTHAEALEFSQTDDSKLEQVTLKTAAMRLYQLFKQFDALDFSLSVENKPEAYTRLFSVLPRITREALRYQKYRDACLQARAEIQKLKDPRRKLSQSETRAIVRHVDSILGLQSMADVGPEEHENGEGRVPDAERNPNPEIRNTDQQTDESARFNDSTI